MPRRLTPDEARAEAVRLRALADEIEQAAEDRYRSERAQAAGLRFTAGEYELAAERGLTITANGGIVRHKVQEQPAADPSRPRRSVGRKPKLDTPFRKWLDETDQTVEEYAARKRIKPSTVKAWTIRGQKKGGRKIPRASATDVQNEAGRDEHGDWRVPATDDSWPNGISD